MFLGKWFDQFKIVQTYTTGEPFNPIIYLHCTIYIYMCIYILYIYILFFSIVVIYISVRVGKFDYLGHSCSFFVGFPGRNYSAPDDELLM